MTPLNALSVIENTSLVEPAAPSVLKNASDAPQLLSAPDAKEDFTSETESARTCPEEEEEEEEDVLTTVEESTPVQPAVLSAKSLLEIKILA